MTCTFFGHSDAPYSIKDALKKNILRLITANGIKRFFVGNNGSFDYLAQSVLDELASSCDDIEYSIVLSTVSEGALNGNQRATVFSHELANSPPRFAIYKRNLWLIKASDAAIIYVRHKFSNSNKWCNKAQKAGLKIINLAEVNE